MLCTDGVNNLLAKQLPDLTRAATPVHIPLPAAGGGNANLGLLRWMAFQTGGSASVGLSQPDEFAKLVSGESEAISAGAQERAVAASSGSSGGACTSSALCFARPVPIHIKNT